MTLFSNAMAAKHPFFDAWESLSEDERQSRMRHSLANLVTFCRREVPWYQERLEGFNPDAQHPLTNVPVLNSALLRQHLPPQSQDLLAKGSEKIAKTVFQSGGTTGVPKTTLFSHQEMEALTLPNARGFFALGLSDRDRVGNVFAVGGLYMTFIHINRMLQEYGCTSFPFSNHTDPQFVHTVTNLFNVNCLTGITSVILNCLRTMRQRSDTPVQIEKIFFGGEHIYEADRRELREHYGVKQIAAPGYGTVDTWYLGYQCTHCQNGEFHTHDDQVWLEIIDDEGRPCQAEKPGMLHATVFVRQLTPIVRYAVGDRAHWMLSRCDCGRTTPRFKLLGRGDDVLRIGYDLIDYDFIQSCVTPFTELSGTVQMEKERVDGKDRLTIRIEADIDPTTKILLQQRLSQVICEQRPSLNEFITKGSVLPPQIVICPLGSLARNARTGKLVRIIDAISDEG